MISTWLRTLLQLAIISQVSCGFEFAVGRAGQCDPLSLSWFGGKPPFQLLVIPPGGIMKNISIPASAYNKTSGQGSYTMQQLELAEETLFMLSMSDATGIFAGGTSDLFTVGPTRSGQHCNTTYPVPDFTYSLDSDLAQCSPYPITLYSGPVVAVLPVRLLVHIPEGPSFAVWLSTSLTWAANLTSKTSVAFTVLDSENRNGGTSPLRIVESTNDTSCLSAPPPPPPQTPSTSDTHHANLSGTKKRALAIGISLGVFALMCLSLVTFWYYKRSRSYKSHNRPAPFLQQRPNSAVTQSLPSVSPPPLSAPRKLALSNSSEETPTFQGLTVQSTSGPRSPELSWPIQNQETTPNGTTQTVTHVDITEITGSPTEHPPQYCENRPPLPTAWLR